MKADMDSIRTPSFDLSGRVAIVTGAGSGMGAASAAALAGYGAKVALLDRDEAAARLVAEEIGKNAFAFHCDVSDSSHVDDCVAKVRADLGAVTIVHNNAAVNMGYGKGDKAAGELTDEVWRINMAVNLDGTFFVTRAVIPDMLENKGGSIINTASLAGPFIGSYNTAYTATKGGVVGFTRALVISYSGTGIRANAICPGFVMTPMSAPTLEDATDRDRYATSVPSGRLGVPEDIGGLVVFLASDASSYVNGAVITLDGGISLR